jgi:hypothetical protein
MRDRKGAAQPPADHPERVQHWTGRSDNGAVEKVGGHHRGKLEYVVADGGAGARRLARRRKDAEGKVLDRKIAMTVGAWHPADCSILN